MSLDRRKLLAAGTAAVLAPDLARAQLLLGGAGSGGFGQGTTGSFHWQPLKVGGGGFTRDIDIAPDGTKVCKIDVYGAYVYNPSVPNPGNAGGLGCWQQLCKPGPIPPGDPAFANGNILSGSTNWFGSCGAYDVRIAPGNSSVVYMLWAGMMYKSTNAHLYGNLSFVNQSNNAGGTFPRQTSANSQSNASGPVNGTGPPMAIDPQNPNVCWLGTLGGIFYTQNGGTTWNTLSTSVLPLPTTSGRGWTGFAFDPQSAVVGGITQGIYCFICGSGVYYSSNAGTSWTLLSGGSFSGTMPTYCVQLVVDKFGVAWVVQDPFYPSTISQNLHNFTVHAGTAFTANTWTVSNTTTGFVWGIAPDPASSTSAAQRLIITDWAGQLAQSTNGGSSWTPAQGYTKNLVATDAPWLATNETSFSLAGRPKFDPSQSNALYYPEGIGVWYANLPTVGGSASWGSWSWYSQTSGIESLETTHIVSPPGGYVGLVQWDRNWFVLNNSNPAATPYPSTYGTGASNPAILAGQGADWAGQTPSFVAIHSSGDDSFSNSYGSPAITGWTKFTTQPAGTGDPNGAAAMAVSTSLSMMVVSNGLYVTTNGGTSAWPNVTPAGSSGWSNGGAQISIQLAADKVTANYYVGCPDSVHVYYSPNSGSSWTTVTPGFSYGGSNGSGVQLKAIPGNAGHFFICFGGSFGSTVDNSNIFYRSTNGGASWADVSQAGYTVREVYVWGYGAIQSGKSYPTIFIYGYVNGVRGVWQSTDNCATWQQVGDAQFGAMTFDVPNAMAGDMNTPGNLYVGFFGSGYLQYAI